LQPIVYGIRLYAVSTWEKHDVIGILITQYSVMISMHCCHCQRHVTTNRQVISGLTEHAPSPLPTSRHNTVSGPTSHSQTSVLNFELLTSRSPQLSV